ncbi:hypothetical protein [Intestinibacillus massiliensis]|uniref:hypothetical protein n=1 Tax=Intestinibacillus massiliensis TaxID=1871029 RepID=UPI000B354CB9|nr:hypothetical protein [Intestinibacillus massiliensis]
MFENHKIPAFARRLADLPDEPQLSAGELKAYFDSSPEELRRAVNGVCDDAAALEGRVDGIVERTFGGAVKEGMIDAGYRGTLATKGDLAALQTNVATAITQAAAQKCGATAGTYQGNGSLSHDIELGFVPLSVIVADPTADSGTTATISFCGLGVPGQSAGSVVLTETGFMVRLGLNRNGHVYVYLALR